MKSYRRAVYKAFAFSVVRIFRIFCIYVCVSSAANFFSVLFAQENITPAGSTAIAGTAGNSPPQTLREKTVAAAKQYIGVPYRYGGITVTGMDCSGFIYTVAREAAGVQLPRTAAAMYSFCSIVNDAQKEPADILFFRENGKITHAGLYIGNNQFVHAVSDGPNTGVIVSSLNQASWKQKYAACGRFLPSEKTEKELPAGSVDGTPAQSRNEHSAAGHSRTSGKALFAQKIALDFSAQLAWNFYTATSFMLNVRGAYLQAHARYTGWQVQPGFAADIRIEPRMHIVQFPLLFTLTVPYGLRIYAGPVFTAGVPHLIGKTERISASVFPGVFGLGWQSPELKADNAGISLVQDISWTVFNDEDNSALPLKDAVVGGLVFSTGVRVTVYAKDVFK